jgi:hypothetical protein
MVKKYYNTIQNTHPEDLKPQQRLQRYFDLYDKGKIDKQTLKAAIDTFSTEHRSRGDDDIAFM